MVTSFIQRQVTNLFFSLKNVSMDSVTGVKIYIQVTSAVRQWWFASSMEAQILINTSTPPSLPSLVFYTTLKRFLLLCSATFLFIKNIHSIHRTKNYHCSVAVLFFFLFVCVGVCVCVCTIRNPCVSLSHDLSFNLYLDKERAECE